MIRLIAALKEALSLVRFTELKSKKLVLAEARSEYQRDTTYLRKVLKKTNRRRDRAFIDEVEDSLRAMSQQKSTIKAADASPVKNDLKTKRALQKGQ